MHCVFVTVLTNVNWNYKKNLDSRMACVISKWKRKTNKETSDVRIKTLNLFVRSRKILHNLEFHG